MPTVSRENASQVVRSAGAEDRTEEFLGYTVNFVSVLQEADLAPLLKGLPDDRCQCPQRRSSCREKHFIWRPATPLQQRPAQNSSSSAPAMS